MPLQHRRPRPRRKAIATPYRGRPSSLLLQKLRQIASAGMLCVPAFFVAATALLSESAHAAGSINSVDNSPLYVSGVRFVDSLSPLVLAALPKGLDFFAEDAQKMEEQAEYAAGHPRHPSGAEHSKACAPRCEWSCEKKECRQTCEPICAPPMCRTLCEKRFETCETRCGPPQCAVVCPQEECSRPSAGCGKCRTICSPPLCTDQCGLQCQNVCEKPKCSYNCTVGSCPQPKCKIACEGFKLCAQAFRPESPTVPPQYPGDRDLVGRVEGYASLDPSVLNQTMTPPAPWSTMKAPHEEAEPRERTGSRAHVGPVEKLRRRWRAADKSWEIDHRARPLLSNRALRVDPGFSA